MADKQRILFRVVALESGDLQVQYNHALTALPPVDVVTILKQAVAEVQHAVDTMVDDVLPTFTATDGKPTPGGGGH